MKKLLSIFGVCSVVAASWWGFTVKSSDFMMAAIGDSMSTAFNADKDWNNLDLSWSAGENIESHYTRLVAKFPDRNIRVINLAVPGVDSSDIERQARDASRVELDYATILIGSNDLCRGLESIDTFRDRMISAIGILIKKSPGIKILLSSTPNIVQAREVASSLTSKRVWSKVMERCDVSDTDRFYEGWWKLNAVLDVIAQNNEQVKYSDGVMLRDIEVDSISEIDCFHANIHGQEAIAEITWAQGWFK